MTLRDALLSTALLLAPPLVAQATVGPWTLALVGGPSYGNVVACNSNAPGMQTGACVTLKAIASVTGPPTGVNGSGCTRIVEATSALTVAPGARAVRFTYTLVGDMVDMAPGETCRVSAYVELDGVAILGVTLPPPPRTSPCPGSCGLVPVNERGEVTVCVPAGPHTVVAGLATYVSDTFLPSPPPAQFTTVDFFNPGKALTVCVSDQGQWGAPIVLYDNGPIVTHPGGGAGGADVSALDNTPTYHPPHNVYGFGVQWASGGGNALADDFTVCGTWSVAEIELFGYTTNTTPPIVTGVYAQIWNGDPRAGGTVIWGDLSTNLVSTPPIGTFDCYRTLIGTLSATNRQVQRARVPVTGLTLTPGTYWLEFQFTGASFCPPVTENTVNVTGDAIQRQGSTWVVLNNAIAPSVAGVAIPFRFHGTAFGQTLAAAATYGAGKAGTNGVAAWDLGTPVRTPILGRDHPLRIVNGFAGATPILVLGSPLPGGLPLPPIGTIYVLPIFTTLPMPAFDGANVSALRLPVPHGAALCGATFGLQAFWADPGAAGSIGHAEGLQLTLGN